MAALIAGDALKGAARKCAAALQAKIDGEQKGFVTIFDKWFMRVLVRLEQLDPARAWEDSLQQEVTRLPPAEASALAWDFARLCLYLDRAEQGRFVDYAQREQSGAHYVPRFGTEFGSDIWLTAQGAPAPMQWRGMTIMKTVFDFALYPMLLAELRPRTVLEIGSGLGGSGVWLADHLALQDIAGHVHSVDLNPPSLLRSSDAASPLAHVTFHKGDCAVPSSLFPLDLLTTAPRPWLVIEDAHHNVEKVLDHMHDFLRPGDYLVVEDSEIKRDDLRRFLAAHPGCYKVDTKYTDYFGRNATCAGDSIFRRV